MNDIEKALERIQQLNAQESVLAKSESVLIAGLQDQESEASRRPHVPDRPIHKLNLQKMESAGFIVPNSERSSVIEEYRALKRPVLMNAFGRGAAPVENGNLVMVSSSVPGEGKTFTTINLAMSMVIELDTTVLLIDADVIRATLTGIFNLRSEPGLVDLLLDEDLEPSDVIVSTDIENLRILPAGRGHQHSTELLSSERMRQLTLDLAQRYKDRVIILDSPPLLAATESRVLSDLAGQILIVVEFGKTPQHAIKEVIETLDKDKVIGMILNKGNRMFRRGYYYGSYGSAR